MNSNTKGLARAACAALAAFATPAIALAETPSGPDILLPKPAEFIPALIAFLVIWVVLAKFACPSILSMMEQRQQEIQRPVKILQPKGNVHPFSPAFPLDFLSKTAKEKKNRILDAEFDTSGKSIAQHTGQAYEKEAEMNNLHCLSAQIQLSSEEDLIDKPESVQRRNRDQIENGKGNIESHQKPEQHGKIE